MDLRRARETFLYHSENNFEEEAMQKKDKEKVFGGEWSEAQLREFLVA